MNQLLKKMKKKKLFLVSLLIIIVISLSSFLILIWSNELDTRSSLENHKLLSNALYLVERNDEYLIFLDGRLYSQQKNIKGAESSEVQFEEIDQLSNAMLLKVPSNTHVLSFLLSEDKTVAFFTLVTFANFEYQARRNPGEGFTYPVITTSYAYYTHDGIIDLLFTSIELKESGFNWYPIISNISSDNQRAAFNLLNCWECESDYPQTMIYDLERKREKNLGKVSDFRWLTSDQFEYKDYIPIECEDQTLFECYSDPSTLSFKKGSWE